MRDALARAGAGLTTVGLVLAITALPAAAHEQRTVGGYQFTVGWQHEPTYVGQLNAVQLLVHDAKGSPVDDLGSPPTLHVTVSTGSATSGQLDLEASFDPDTGLGTHGEFDAPLIPETPGVYKFHFTGTMPDGSAVDQTFTSSDSTFNDVQQPTAVEFPVQPPAAADVAAGVARLQPRVASAVSTAKSAHDDASTATVLAIVALVVGVVVGGAGLLVGLGGRRRHA